MVSPLFSRRRGWSIAGPGVIVGGILACLVMLGMLAMHGVHMGAHSSQSSSFQSSTAATSSMHGQSTPASAIDDTVAHTGTGMAPAASCASCAPEQLSMAANCGAAVVLAFLLLLPGMLLGRPWQPVRAGPLLPSLGLPLPSAPSLNVLCINRS